MKHERYAVGKRVGSLCRMASIAMVLCVVLISCNRDPRLDSLLQMEPTPELPTSRERTEELKAIIAEYEEVVNEKIYAAVKQASYLKLLAQEYMRAELFGPALETIEEAILIEPRNKVLHQLAGVCAAYLGKSRARDEERSRYLTMAERFYLASIEIDPDYRDGLYALGTLYHFELGRHLEAVAVLERLLDRIPNHVQALFVLARAHAALGNVDDAIRAYETIIDNAPDHGVAEQARRFRLLLQGEVE